MSYSFCIKKCNMSTFLLTLNLSENIYENYSYSTTHIQNVCFTHFITIYFLGTHIVSTHTAAKWVILISWLLYFLLTLILSEEMYEKCSYKYHSHSKCVFHSFHIYLYLYHLQYDHSSLGNIYFSVFVSLDWSIKNPAVWRIFKYLEKVCYEEFLAAIAAL